MRKIYKVLLAILIVSGISFKASAQQGYWSSRSDNSGITADKAVARQSFPSAFKLFELNVDPLRQELFAITDNQAKHSMIISLPNADGNYEQFEVTEAPNFELALQAKFPQIRAFSGKGITDKSATLKLSISPQGIQTMVFRTDKENEFIEPYSQDHTVYAVFKSQRKPGQLAWTCSTEDKKMFSDISSTIHNINRTESSTGELKTMRLAQSCNGEYSNFFGAFNASQVALVLAAFNATLTRCNGCYEKDLALHLNLIANTTAVIFYDPATDPYTSMGAWNGQLQATLTAIIGEANYDIGHMFGASGGGGNAGCIGCVCVDGQKGSGITSPADAIPQGDNFDIDYVVHEVGHQLGANHTFSMSLEGTGVNKEVGSGITIMGYAGITSQDVAPHSIDIFHEASIQQIQGNLAGKTCPITTNITANNATPVVAPVSNYTIPLSTPFALTGSATDANAGDVLTYCWEQNDNSTTSGSNSVASPTKLTGPNWLSFSPTVSPVRYFPRLSTILTGGQVTGPLPGGDAGANIEALSSVARALNFRLTVRDNSPYVPTSSPNPKVGQTAFTDMVVTVTNTSGPFQVTSPNTNVSWAGGSSQTITWDVNGTTGAPVSCANVKISLSTDGGQTFPTIIAASTANDGTEIVIVPLVTTTTARIKIEAIGNIFFDISNANFSITVPPNGFTFNIPAAVTASCPAPDVMTSGNLTATYTGTFTGNINLTGVVSPSGPTVSFSNTTLTTASPSTTVSLTGMAALNFGNYTVTVTGVGAGGPTVTRDIIFTINPGAGPVIITHPSPQIVCSGANASFTVTATGTYQWQVSTAAVPAFTNIGGATSATYTITAGVGLNGNQYRCVVSSQCGITNSNAATLTVNTAPAISTNPQSATLCAGSNNTFNVSATGAGLTYQWQVSTVAVPAFTDIPSATSASYTINGITTGMNSNQYRCVISGTCTPAATSGAATLTVVAPVTVTGQPTNTAVCNGNSTSFSVAGSGSGVIYQWQVNDGTGFVNITNTAPYSGVTGATLTITVVSSALNTYQYRCQLSNAVCTTPAVSNAATLTVNTLPAISTSPVAVTICAGSSNTFSAAATGTGITYQWQMNTTAAPTFVDIPTATSATYTVANATAGMNGNQYRCVVTGTCAPAAITGVATLTVISPVVVTTQPANVELCSGSNTSFTVVGNSSQTISYQWQISTGTLPAFTNIAGATSATLSLTSATTGMSGNQYRCQLSNTTCTAPTTSNTVALTVRQLPTVGLVAAPLLSLLPGKTTTLTATPSTQTTGTLTTSWIKNGTAITNAGNTRIINVENTGTYRVNIQEVFTGGLTCSNQSPVITIDATVSDRLFIFPSPNDGQFTVSYYNNSGNSTTRTVTIYDSRGTKVRYKTFPVSGPYTLLSMDVRPAQKGIYYVVVGDASGNKLVDGKVLVQ
jgi:hypothetical protein